MNTWLERREKSEEALLLVSGPLWGRRAIEDGGGGVQGTSLFLCFLGRKNTRYDTCSLKPVKDYQHGSWLWLYLILLPVARDKIWLMVRLTTQMVLDTDFCCEI